MSLRSRILVKVREWSALAQTLADCGVREWDHETAPLRIVRVPVPQGVDADALLGRLRAHANVDPTRTTYDLSLGVRAAYHAPIRDARTASESTAGLVNYAAPYASWMLTWHHGRLNTYRAWQIVNEVVTSRRGPKPGGGMWCGDPAIEIGFVDTGIIPLHDDVPTIPPEDQYDANAMAWGNAEDYGLSAVWGTTTLTPARHGHGTMVLGIVSAKHNATGTSGIAPDCRPIVVKVSDPDPMDLSISAICNGLVAAADRGIPVLSNSWGYVDGTGTLESALRTAGEPPTTEQLALMKDAVEYAIQAGALFAAACGNSGVNLDTRTDLPSEIPGVISVAAVTAYSERIAYSNWGSKVDASAPVYIGCPHYIEPPDSPIRITFNGGAGAAATNEPIQAYQSGTGTSASTPAVAGVLGLILSVNPALGAAAARAILFSTVSPFLDPTGQCEATYYPGANRYGFARGVVNAAKACSKAKASVSRGTVVPYIGFLGRHWTQGDPAPRHVTGPDQWFGFSAANDASKAGPQAVLPLKDAAGNVRTTLSGQVWIEAYGYAYDASGNEIPVTTAEVWLDGRRLYAGPAGLLEATATSDGEVRAVKIVAHTAGGLRAEETYEADFKVASLTSAAFAPVAFTAHVAGTSLYGTRSAGVPITVNGAPTAEPTPTTWSYESTLPPGSHVMAVSDGVDVVEVLVEAGAGPRTIRAEAAGVPVYATIIPGADGDAVVSAVLAGGLTVASASALPAYPVAAGPGPVGARALSSFQGVSVAAAAGEVLISSKGHRLRAVAGGAPVYAALVPGVDGFPAAASAAAGALAVGAQIPVPGAAATVSAATIILPVGAPSATISATTGGLRASAARTAPAAGATATAGGLGLLSAVPAATATAYAGGLAISAGASLAATQASTAAGAVAFGVAVSVPGVEVSAAAAAAIMSAALRGPAASMLATAGTISGPEIPVRRVDLNARTVRVGILAPNQIPVGIRARAFPAGLRAQRSKP